MFIIYNLSIGWGWTLPENTASPRIVPFSSVSLEPPSVVYLKTITMKLENYKKVLRQKSICSKYVLEIFPFIYNSWSSN